MATGFSVDQRSELADIFLLYCFIAQENINERPDPSSQPAEQKFCDAQSRISYVKPIYPQTAEKDRKQNGYYGTFQLDCDKRIITSIVCLIKLVPQIQNLFLRDKIRYGEHNCMNVFSCHIASQYSEHNVPNLQHTLYGTNCSMLSFLEQIVLIFPHEYVL